LICGDGDLAKFREELRAKQNKLSTEKERIWGKWRLMFVGKNCQGNGTSSCVKRRKFRVSSALERHIS